MTSKTYGQFCGVARALDHVGDRWSLLILRELLIERSLGFGDLLVALPGISPNLLVDRLRHLERDGCIERNDARVRSKAVRYSLTKRGCAIEPVLVELIRFGAPWMFDGPGDDLVDPRWAVLALRALLTDEARRSDVGSLHVSVEELDLTVNVGRRGRSVEQGAPPAGRARASLSFESLLSVSSGLKSFDDAGIEVSGDLKFAYTALHPRRVLSASA